MKDTKVREEDTFWLKGAEPITCVHQLIDSLHEMEEPVFTYHVTKNKNDFAIWIRNAFGEKALARQIENLNNPSSMAAILDAHLERSGHKTKKKVKHTRMRQQKEDRTLALAGLVTMILVGLVAIALMVGLT